MLPGDGPFPERNTRLYQKQSLGEKARPSPVGSQRRGWRGKQTLSILVGRLYMLSWFLLRTGETAGGQINTPPSRASSLPHPRGIPGTRLSPRATRLLPPAGCVTHGRVYTSNLSPSFHSLLPRCVHRSMLHTCVSIPALHTGAAAPLSRFYTHTHALSFSLPDSLPVIGSTPTHTSSMDSNPLLLGAE